MIKKTVWHFTKSLSKEEKKKLRLALNLLKTEISIQIVQFDRTYFKYIRNSKDNYVLIISSFELTFCSNIIIAFIFNKSGFKRL